MFLWHFILLIIVFNTVCVQSQKSTDGVIKKDVRLGVASAGYGEDESMVDVTFDDADDFQNKNNDGDSQTGNDDDPENDDDDPQNDNVGGSQDKQQNSPEKDDENDQNDGDENGDDKNKGDAKRALQAGDTFTPVEMLPITKKLLGKVTKAGTGIVSGAKSAEDLADKLFAAYFLTSRRIVVLSDKDLYGLDALQALAFSGEGCIV